jgi:ankyrin repeat protein
MNPHKKLSKRFLVVKPSPILSNNKFWYHLAKSCREGDLNTVKYYIGMGADPSKNNNKCLIYAIENNHVDIVKYLINECNVNPFYNDGEAMFIAVQYENIPMLYALFKEKLANKNTIVE